MVLLDEAPQYPLLAEAQAVTTAALDAFESPSHVGNTKHLSGLLAPQPARVPLNCGHWISYADPTVRPKLGPVPQQT